MLERLSNKAPEPYQIPWPKLNPKESQYDLIVIGSGMAGLSVINWAPPGRICWLAKEKLHYSNTGYAQGGFAAALDPGDSPELHMEDTLKAGDDFGDPEAVRVLVQEGPEALLELFNLGLDFDGRKGEDLSFSLEGGHSKKRIIHHGDNTGEWVVDQMVKRCKVRQGLDIKEDAFVAELCVEDSSISGVVILNANGEIEIIKSSTVVLATGGAGQLYSHTTNPLVATGDGMALAYRAGAVLAEMEMIQFHPTAMFQEDSNDLVHPHPLISETVRGEGAYLLNCSGDRFMTEVHPDAELAPRDVVCREMVKQMKNCGTDYLYLDLRHLQSDKMKNRFPHIWNNCVKAGFDPADKLVPVAPAAHFFIGGVATDLYGRTNVNGLYAVGETASTGVHGANRLASNSLLECLVFGRRVSSDLSKRGYKNTSAETAALSSPGEIIKARRRDLKKIMSAEVGIERRSSGLSNASNKFSEIAGTSDKVIKEALEDANLLLLARIVTQSALIREESRGVHYRDDFPHGVEKWRERRIEVSRDGWRLRRWVN